MFCPRCGQQQSNDYARFCSRCRFVMTGMDRVIREGGLPAPTAPVDDNYVSPKILGLKQGGIMILSGFVVVPVIAILSELFNVEPVIAGFAAIVLFLGGFLRLIYALIFQPHRPTHREQAGFVDSLKQIFLGANVQRKGELPQPKTSPGDFEPSNVNWRDTSDLDYQRVDREYSNPYK